MFKKIKEATIYDVICAAAQVIGKPKPTFTEVSNTIENFCKLGGRNSYDKKEVQMAWREFTKAPVMR